MSYEKEARELLNDLVYRSRDEMVDILIKLGESNSFIPVMIEFVSIAKAEGKYQSIKTMEECMNHAYSPGLRAHVLDDFIREKLKLQSELNELKTAHKIYVLEQKVYMYEQAEEMLRGSATNGATHEIMKILEFRGDFLSKND